MDHDRAVADPSAGDGRLAVRSIRRNLRGFARERMALGYGGATALVEFGHHVTVLMTSHWREPILSAGFPGHKVPLHRYSCFTVASRFSPRLAVYDPTLIRLVRTLAGVADLG